MILKGVTLHSKLEKEYKNNHLKYFGLKKSFDYPEKGNGNALQYSCLENPMDRGAWQATVHSVPRVGHNLATKP